MFFGGQGQEHLWDKKKSLTVLLHRMIAALSAKLRSISHRRSNTPFCCRFCSISDHRINVAQQTKCSVKCQSFEWRCNPVGEKVWACWPPPAVSQTIWTSLTGNDSLWSLLLPGQRVATSQISECPHSQQKIFVAKGFAVAKRPLEEECGSPVYLRVHELGRNQGRKRLDLIYNFWLNACIFFGQNNTVLSKQKVFRQFWLTCLRKLQETFKNTFSLLW